MPRRPAPRRKTAAADAAAPHGPAPPPPFRAAPAHGTVREPLGPSPRMADEQAVAFIKALAEANPLPKSELDHHDPFELLIAVVLSAQTTDAAVNRCTPAHFAAAPPQKKRRFLRVVPPVWRPPSSSVIRH